MTTGFMAAYRGLAARGCHNLQRPNLVGAIILATAQLPHFRKKFILAPSQIMLETVRDPKTTSKSSAYAMSSPRPLRPDLVGSDHLIQRNRQYQAAVDMIQA